MEKKKRLGLARVLVDNSDVYILDEPTSELDTKNIKDVWKTIFSCTENKTLICATHDTDVLEKFDRVIELGSASILYDGRPQDKNDL